MPESYGNAVCDVGASTYNRFLIEICFTAVETEKMERLMKKQKQKKAKMLYEIISEKLS